tara:strand:- start:142 stop:336 length:195 start_codon:yes stop_codon:yes gene_type:complete
MKLVITLIKIVGLIVLFYYLKNIKTIVINIFPWLVKKKKIIKNQELVKFGIFLFMEAQLLLEFS